MPPPVDAASQPQRNVFPLGDCNPPGATSTSGGAWAWNSYAGSGGAITLTPNLAATWTPTGRCTRSTWTTAPAGNEGDIGMQMEAVLTPRQPYYAAFTVVSSKATRLGIRSANWSPAGATGTFVGLTPDVVVTPGQPYTFAGIITPGATATGVKVYVGVVTGTGVAPLAVGDTLDASMGVLCPAAAAPPGGLAGGYFDGSLPGCQWAGTAHASESRGYPYTLESIAGTPLFDLTSAQTVLLDPAAFDPFPRGVTVLAVVDLLGTLAVNSPDSIVSYGTYTGGVFADTTPPGNFTGRLIGTGTTTPPNFQTRYTGGGGPLSSPSGLTRHVAIFGASVTGSAVASNTAAPTFAYAANMTALAHQAVRVWADTATHHTVRVVGLPAYGQTSAMRAAALLARQYGATVPAGY